MPRTSHPSAIGTKSKAENGRNENPAKRHKSNRQGWADAMLKFLDDPSEPAVIYCDKEIMAVENTQPKAEIHYLVMPRDRKYRSPEDLLAPEGVEMLHKMENVANKLVHDFNEDYPNLEYRYGFHAVPSMNHLHMHVISQDFDSRYLHNKKQWNSFTTTFFVPFEEMLLALEKGDVDFSYRERRLNDGMKCHRCGIVQSNIPQLKEHIKDCTCDPYRVPNSSIHVFH